LALLDTLIIAALVLGWGWVLGKPVLANLAGSMRRDPVGSFNRQLDVLGRAPRLAVAAPAARLPASRRQAARRRQVFLALVISVVTSLGMAVVFGGVFTTLHVVMDILLLSYLGLAAAAGRQAVRRSPNVVPLRPAPTVVFQPRYAPAAGDR
jgi:hypothetical protein